MMTGRASARMRWRRFSSASTPTGRSRGSARIPASASPSPSRSSRRMADASGRRTAARRRAQRSQGARRPLHRAPAGGVESYWSHSAETGSTFRNVLRWARRRAHHPCFRGARRGARRAHPRAVRRRQVAPRAGAHPSRAERLAAVRPPGGRRPRACRSRERTPAGSPAGQLAGLIEVRGLGIRRAAVRAGRGGRAGGRPCGRRCRAAAATRRRTATFAGITLPRLAVAAGSIRFPLPMQFLRSLRRTSL